MYYIPLDFPLVIITIMNYNFQLTFEAAEC